MDHVGSRVPPETGSLIGGRDELFEVDEVPT